ncbi:hypothetical protein NDU88_006445 [Pleurodeles waltl]|uniref:Integrase catalytic domain-containing protein n=1 Tax=Pleurodeles waltl TaxID=8319 RepID=A0AAV7TX50_PLEWA|nr:hypothetical protein NDU88_006445 [Pleurodeles waltl]
MPNIVGAPCPKLAEAPCPLWGLVRGNREQKGTLGRQEPRPHHEQNALLRDLRTENGTPFSSQEFAEYMASRGVHHRKIISCWPQANGEAELFM